MCFAERGSGIVPLSFELIMGGGDVWRGGGCCTGEGTLGSGTTGGCIVVG